VTHDQPRAGDRTTVEFPARADFRSVGRLVLGGVASRFELPIDRVDDLLLAVESLLLQETLGETVRLDTQVTPTGLSVRLAPFRPGQLADPALLRVLARLVDEVQEQVDGDEAAIELLVSAAYRRDGA
jgi:hypothetical protein